MLGKPQRKPNAIQPAQIADSAEPAVFLTEGKPAHCCRRAAMGQGARSGAYRADAADLHAVGVRGRALLGRGGVETTRTYITYNITVRSFFDDGFSKS